MHPDPAVRAAVFAGMAEGWAVTVPGCDSFCVRPPNPPVELHEDNRRSLVTVRQRRSARRAVTILVCWRGSCRWVKPWWPSSSPITGFDGKLCVRTSGNTQSTEIRRILAAADGRVTSIWQKIAGRDCVRVTFCSSLVNCWPRLVAGLATGLLQILSDRTLVGDT